VINGRHRCATMTPQSISAGPNMSPMARDSGVGVCPRYPGSDSDKHNELPVSVAVRTDIRERIDQLEYATIFNPIQATP